jgi:hypothetical protein
MSHTLILEASSSSKFIHIQSFAYFCQPASESRLAYIFPISPIPISPIAGCSSAANAGDAPFANGGMATVAGLDIGGDFIVVVESSLTSAQGIITDPDVPAKRVMEFLGSEI